MLMVDDREDLRALRDASMETAEMVEGGETGCALMTISSLGRKEMVKVRKGVVSKMAWSSWRSSSNVSANFGPVRRKPLKGSLLAAFFWASEKLRALVASIAAFLIRRHSLSVFIGAMTNRGVLNTNTCRCGSGSMLSLSKPKSSAKEWMKAR